MAKYITIISVCVHALWVDIHLLVYLPVHMPLATEKGTETTKLRVSPGTEIKSLGNLFCHRLLICTLLLLVSKEQLLPAICCQQVQSKEQPLPTSCGQKEQSVLNLFTFPCLHVIHCLPNESSRIRCTGWQRRGEIRNKEKEKARGQNANCQKARAMKWLCTACTGGIRNGAGLWVLKWVAHNTLGRTLLCHTNNEKEV